MAPPFDTCSHCGAVLYMGSRCWNCSPPRVVREEDAPEIPTFNLPNKYLALLNRRAFK